ncbi:hypothetical protein ACFL6B_04560 [Thermodesulfobacteriota bacterium]
MNTFRWLQIFSLIFIFICPASQAGEARLGVGFSWEGIAECSNYSPEIKVSNIPSVTKSFQVLLKNLDDPSSYHGGGTVENDKSGIIPAGALKGDYKGPCPSGKGHRYQFTVNAIGSLAKSVGKGKATRIFP